MKTRKNLFMTISLVFLFLLGVSSFGASTVFAKYENKVKPGEFVIEPPTLISLGFEWYVEGDDNRDATVEVWYRKKGDTAWKEALPFLRLNKEQVITDAFNFVAPNMFAGSIFDLEPDTEYECMFVMSDPDGVIGFGHPSQIHPSLSRFLESDPRFAQKEVSKIVTVRTRAEPKPFEGGRTFHVYPRGYSGPKQQPAYTGLVSAYFTGTSNTDHYNVYPPRVEPGDIILVHAGLYKETARFVYGGAGLGTPFDATYYLTRSGTPDKPIVIKAAGDGEVIFDGDGNANLFNVMAGNYNYFEGLTIRNTDVAFQAGHKNIAGAVGLTVKKCRFENVGIGVHTDYSGSKNFYIADNVILGKDDPNALLGWRGATWQNLPGYPREIRGWLGVKVYGSGHVVCHNYVANFHDGIDHATYGNPDGNPNPNGYEAIRDRMPVSIDIYNNDISNISDNCIEADGAMHNIRVLRNRCFNVAHRALSTQPVLGGPAYFIRNIVYHAPEGGAIKWFDNSAGTLLFHNTLCAQAIETGTGYVPYPTSNVHHLNNLILWQGPFKGAFKEVLYMDTFTNYTTSDYNGYLPNPNADYSFVWESPPFDMMADYVNPRVVRNFATLQAYQQGAGQDEHSILIDWNIFVNVSPPDPNNPQRLYKPAELDFQLKPNAVAVDAGCILPNVNDHFFGNAPDLGALELYQEMPIYGPRP